MLQLDFYANSQLIINIAKLIFLIPESSDDLLFLFGTVIRVKKVETL